MTNDPQQPEPAEVKPEIAPPVAQEAPATHDSVVSDSAASRIREKMAAAAIEQHAEQALGGNSGSNAAPTGRQKIEIPGADDLDSSLEAEIQAVMQTETAAPEPAVTAAAESGPASTEEVGQGSKIRGIVQQINGDDVFLDAGLRTNVVVSLRQFPADKPPEVGSEVQVIVDEMDADGLIKARLPKGRHKPAGNWDSLAVGQVVDCMVAAVNKGGLQVTVSGLRGFMPASQVELGFAGNLEQYVGQKVTVQVTEVNPKKRNLVVSRKALLQAERQESEGEFWSTVEVGKDFSGTVKTIKDYGAFVNIGSVDGFLHIGEISWSRINHPADVLKEGQTVDVKILKLDPEKKRISLGMKQLAQNPWASAEEKYSTGRTISGKVTRITDFGAFVELEPGLEGMVHISELAWRRVGSVSEILTPGETRDFQVQELDSKRKRVSLSLKALEKKPEPVRTERPEPEEAPAPEPRKPRNQNLRGGTDRDSKRGGLFGNPSDFS
ncbi:MAG: 30S ribosomal protein S1 [Planctomyces sp.]|jgi:small subunit ribosomal protein S1